MSIIKKGTDFGPTEQVTSTKLDNLVDNASFTDTSANAVAYTGSTGTCLQGGGLEVTSAGQLQVKDSGITTAKLNDNAVTTAKITDLNVTTAKIAADAITTAKIADDIELGGNPTTTTQAAGNNTTRIATTAFVNTAVTNSFAPSIVFTSDARNSESQSYYKNLTEIDDPNSLISINSTSEIQFASTGTYMIEAGIGLDDNDSSGAGDTYEIHLVKGNSSTTAISFQGVTFSQWNMTTNAGGIAAENVLVTFQVPYTVSNTTDDRLSIYAAPVSGAETNEWEGFATIKITKIA
jgi:hypothetical protein